MALVYRLICKPTGLEYIGYTSRELWRRWRGHQDDAAKDGPRRKNSRLLNAVRKYGPRAFEVHVVADGLSNTAALQLESALIREWGTLSPAGLNLTTGGDHVELTDEVRRKIGAKTRARLAAVRAGKKPQALGLLAEGVDDQTIAKETGVCQATIYRWAKEAGYDRTKSKKRTQHAPEAARLLAEGLNHAQIAARLGVGERSVYRWLRAAQTTP